MHAVITNREVCIPSEQEKFYGFLNDATAPVQWALREIRDWLKLLGIVAMTIIIVVGTPFWLAFWWAIGGNSMEQEEENVYIARISQPFVADFSRYHGSPRGNPDSDPLLSFEDQHPSPCDSQPRLLAAVGDSKNPMWRSYTRAKYNMENLCRFVSMTNPNPDLSAAPLVTLWYDRSGVGRVVGMCSGGSWSQRPLPHCNDPKDQVPAVSRFGGLTEGQRRAVNLSESTLSDDFWLQVASANGITDTAVVRAAAKNSRTFNDKFNKSSKSSLMSAQSFLYTCLALIITGCAWVLVKWLLNRDSNREDGPDLDNQNATQPLLDPEDDDATHGRSECGSAEFGSANPGVRSCSAAEEDSTTSETRQEEERYARIGQGFAQFAGRDDWLRFIPAQERRFQSIANAEKVSYYLMTDMVAIIRSMVGDGLLQASMLRDILQEIPGFRHFQAAGTGFVAAARILGIEGMWDDLSQYLDSEGLWHPVSLQAVAYCDAENGHHEALDLARLFEKLVLETSRGDESLACTVNAYRKVLASYSNPVHSQQSSANSAQNERGTPDSFEADCRTLGVSPYVTKAELRSAYINKAKEWHPDRLEGMAPELKDYANRQLAQISAAYVRLKEAKTEVL